MVAAQQPHAPPPTSLRHGRASCAFNANLRGLVGSTRGHIREKEGKGQAEHEVTAWLIYSRDKLTATVLRDLWLPTPAGRLLSTSFQAYLSSLGKARSASREPGPTGSGGPGDRKAR